jgi:hypothetical protein
MIIYLGSLIIRATRFARMRPDAFFIIRATPFCPDARMRPDGFFIIRATSALTLICCSAA